MALLAKLGQSPWLDYISRCLIDRGTLRDLIAGGLRGLTSNPTIFDKAISSSSDYDQRIANLAKSGKTSLEIYDDLTVRDIQDAADLFLPVYRDTGGLDGYVSLEINPQLAQQAGESIAEGKRISAKVNRPNLMLKVPATDQGLLAIEELTTQGLNVNATLIFSLNQYANTAQSYLKGLRRFLKKNSDASGIRSVASVFVSRLDARVDKLLTEEHAALKGRAAVANARMIYAEFCRIFSAGQFAGLKTRGANLQRVLWGSTSTKNNRYSDIKYVQELIGKNTVNTIPQNTLAAFLDHGKVERVLTNDAQPAEKTIGQLAKLGIDVNLICQELLEQGLTAFKNSFDSLLASISAKAKQLCQV